MKKILIVSLMVIALLEISRAAMQSSITKNSITWTFNKAYEVGTFVNGDYWVVGPVTINSISPGWNGITNGSMLDPESFTSAQSFLQGYDTRPGAYRESTRMKYPVTISGVKSIMSTIGRAEQYQGGSYQVLAKATVLTVVNQTVPSGTFRPAYVKGSKKMWHISEIRYDLLPKLPKPSVGLPVQYQNYMKEVWLDHHGPGAVNARLHPDENMPPYPRDSGVMVSNMALMVMMDIPEREMLLHNFIQLGIDLAATALINEDSFAARGGFGNGRKWPILFTSIMLDAPSLYTAISTTALFTPNYNYSVDKFGEDGHTFYGQPSADYPAGRPLFGKVCNKGYKNHDCRDPEGLVNGPTLTGFPAGSYRTCCTSAAWVGQALAARIMRAEALWGHDAFFDYVDTWAIEAETINESNRFRFGSDFNEELWKTYRFNLPPDISGSGGNIKFTANKFSGEPPLTVTFTNTSSDFTSWLWEFGDGSTSTEKNPTHTYTTLGSYSVKLSGTGNGENESYVWKDAISVNLKDVIIEAETMTLNGYKIDTGKLNGLGIMVDPNLGLTGTGTASTTFNGASGTYSITLTIFPENDGSPQIKLKVGTQTVISETYPTDPEYHSLTSTIDYTVTGVTLNSGDLIVIEGTSGTDGSPNGGAYARVDKITIKREVGPASIDLNKELKISNINVPFSIMPNPMVSEISFNFIKIQNAELRIYSATGKLLQHVESINGSHLQWDGTTFWGENVDSGVYFYHINAGNEKYSGVIIKIK